MRNKSVIFDDDSKKYSVLLPLHLVQTLKEMCLAKPSLETGGILVGRYSKDFVRAMIMHIEGPPLDSTSGSTWFVRGIQGLKKRLESFWKQEHLYYLGEWHYHPFSSPAPSNTDHEFMRTISSQRKVDCKVPVLLILGGDPQNAPQISVTVYENDKPIPLKTSQPIA